MKRAICFALLTVSVLATAARAGEQPVNGRYLNFPSQSDCTNVEGEQGRVICSFTTSSVVVGSDGEMSKRSVVGSLDWTHGAGPLRGETVSTFADGSTLTTTWEGESRTEDGRGPIINGTYECVGGTGRFEAAECHGSWTSENQKGGFALGSYQGTITLPD